MLHRLLPALLVAATSLTSCSKPTDGPLVAARDVVLVTFDTTRYDRTSVGGHAAARTPSLDRLVEDGVAFDRAYAPVPVTLPSHATLLSGRSPIVHAIRQNGTTAVDGSIELVAERFRGAGFRTGAFVSSLVLDARFGLARGFETYDAPPDGAAERRGAATAARAVDWLRTRPRDERVFLWMHLFDPHAPYDPPRAFQELPPYDGEIAAADAALADLLAALDGAGRYDAALIVVTADHGEGLSDHGEAEHGMFLYEEAIHVPLVIKLPDAARAGSRVDRVVALVDVAPTVLARAGLGGLAAAEGVDLTPLLDAGDAPPRPAYAETWVPREFHGFAPLFAWIDGQDKFIEAPRAEFYDLANDPRERENRIEREGARAADLAAALARYRDGLGGAAKARTAVSLSTEERRAMEELGYVSGAGDSGGMIDPKDGIKIHNLVIEATASLDRDPARALDLVRKAQAIDPRNRTAAVRELDALVRLGRAPEGAARLEALLARDKTFFEGWLRLGEARGPSDAAAAARCFRRAVDLAPDNFEANYNLAQALRESGDPAGARRSYEKAMALDRSALVLNALAWHLATADAVLDPARAAALAGEAIRIEPQNADFHDTLAEARAKADDYAGAVAAMRDALRLSRGPRPDFEQRLAEFEIRAR